MRKQRIGKFRAFHLLSDWTPIRACGIVLVMATVLAHNVSAQVSPAEILNPKLQMLEQSYFHQLQTLNRSIGSIRFPFSFVLSRYVGADPGKQAEMDSRGLEFVDYHGSTVLKISGNYNAAYNAARMTQNQRAGETFADVVKPILNSVASQIPSDVQCDLIGFEIAYHVRRRLSGSDYEGKEFLVLLLTPEDAFALDQTHTQDAEQEILNRSQIYLDGKELALALGTKDPAPPNSLDKAASQPVPPRPPSNAGVVVPAKSTGQTPTSLRLPRIGVELQENAPSLPAELRPQPGSTSVSSAIHPPATDEAVEAPAPPPAPIFAPEDAERIQAGLQTALDAFAKLDPKNIQFVTYAPPSIVVYKNEILLQVTLRNPLQFQKDVSSIYKRAAQSFDLYLALQLKAIVEKMPHAPEIVGLDVTLLNQISPGPKPKTEALEFILPLKPLQQFLDAEITNQDLIGRSVVLVNGVRIALNLQAVE